MAKRPFVVGFAAETNDVEENARIKLKRKKLDMIAANQVGDGIAFDCEDNALTVLWPGGKIEIARAPKIEVARALIALIAQRLPPPDGAPAPRLEKTPHDRGRIRATACAAAASAAEFDEAHGQAADTGLADRARISAAPVMPRRAPPAWICAPASMRR